MGSLSSKEFFEQLKTNNLKPFFMLKGIVKRSESNTDVLFAGKKGFGNWIRIPATMINSVYVVSTFLKEDETFAVVKIHLVTPSTDEGKVLYDLLASLLGDEIHEEKCCDGYHSMSGSCHCRTSGSCHCRTGESCHCGPSGSCHCRTGESCHCGPSGSCQCGVGCHCGERSENHHHHGDCQSRCRGNNCKI